MPYSFAPPRHAPHRCHAAPHLPPLPHTHTHTHTPTNQPATGPPPFRPRYNALIDTGALITGYTNHQVIRFVLKHDEDDMFDVGVFLNDHDQQVFVTKANDTDPKPIKQCGTPLKRRFTLYDQRHTTGTDIKQAPNARALATLGKGITFRDHSQACWRMRQIAKGQCIDVLLVDEVVKLVTRELKKDQGMNNSRVSVTMEMVMTWMLRNNMLMESMQQIQLSDQVQWVVLGEG